MTAISTDRPETAEQAPLHLRPVEEHLWVAQGAVPSFFGRSFPTRLVVVRFNHDQVWIHSPIQLTPGLENELESLGEVCYLIAPNHRHHLHLDQWQQAYPTAQSFGTQEVIDKRWDLPFAHAIDKTGSYPWSDEIVHLLFHGSRRMTEAVFFHAPSATLILTDLIGNLSPRTLGRWQRMLARAAGVVAPSGTMPLNWRLSVMFRKAEARSDVRRMKDWHPRRIIMAHGDIVTTGAVTFLERSFRWLEAPSPDR